MICAWCMAPLDTAREKCVIVSNTDEAGTRHELGWHLNVCARMDPVYRAVLAAPRMPGNALMIVDERRRTMLEDQGDAYIPPRLRRRRVHRHGGAAAMTDHAYRFRQELLAPMRREADRRLALECLGALARLALAVGLLFGLAACGCAALAILGRG